MCVCGGGGGGVVPLIFNSSFSAVVLIEVVLMEHINQSFLRIQYGFQVKSLSGKVHRAFEVNQGMYYVTSV